MRNSACDVVVPFALTALCIIVFFALVLPPTLRDIGAASINQSSDLQSYFLPKYIFGTDELLGGTLPVWNIYEYGGLPFLATTQPAVFYPPKIFLYWLFTPGTAHVVFLISHYLLAALGFVLFLREQRVGREGRFIGAVAFIFSVPILAGNYHPTRIANLAWMPFAFLFVARLQRGERKLSSFAGLCLAVALQLNAGYPEFTLDMGLFVLVFVLASWAAEAPKRPYFAALFMIGGAFLLGGLISAIQLLPLVEAGVEAKRTAVASQVIGGDILKPGAIALGTLLPYSFYVPGLAAFGLLCVSARRGWPALALVVVCIVLANGAGLLLVKLPGFSMIRFPFAFLLVMMFFPAWAAAVGSDEFVRARAAPPLRQRALIGVVLLGATVLAVYYATRVPALAQELVKGEAARYQTAGGSVVAVLGLGLVIASGIALMKGWRFSELLLFGSGLLVVAQLSAFPFGSPPAPFERPGEHGEIKRLLGRRPHPEGRAFSLHDVLYGYNLTDRIPSVFGIEESFLPWRFREIKNRLRLIPFFGYVDVGVLSSMPGFLDAMDVQYVAAKPAESSVFERMEFSAVARDDKAVLFENPDRMGRAWVNYTVRHFQSDEQVLQHITSKGFDPHVEVVVSERLKGNYPSRAEFLATPARAVQRTAPTTLDLQVELPRPGVLVVSEAAYPGWKAWVNGKPVEWIRANYLLRGIELESGSHQVRFRYESSALRLGAWLSCAGLSLLLLIVVRVDRLVMRLFRSRSSRAAE